MLALNKISKTALLAIWIHQWPVDPLHRVSIAKSASLSWPHHDDITSRHQYLPCRHQMETFSALLAFYTGNSRVPGEFPAQRPVTRSFGVFFDLRLNKRLSKQSWGWWFETLSRPLWHHRNECWLRAHAFPAVYRLTHIHTHPCLRSELFILGT